MKLSRFGARCLGAAGVATLAWAALTAPANAQYQWREDNGQMVYSDKPPPAHIKPANILRAQPMATVARPAPSPDAVPAPSVADRRLEDKRRAEEAARKEKEEAEKVAQKAAACDQMRAEQRTLDSGMRIATVLPNGEREYLSDENRDRRSAELRRNIAEICT